MANKENEPQTKNNINHYNTNYLNNLLVEVTQTLNTMRNVIEELRIRQSPGNTHLKENNNPKKKQKLLNDNDHGQTKDKQIEVPINSIKHDVNLVGQLIKNIFQKVDDSNYQCQDEICSHLRQMKKEDTSPSTLKSKEYPRNDLNKDKHQKSTTTKLSINKEKANFNSKPLIEKFKFDPKCKNKKNVAVLQNKILCTCSPIEEYYRNKGCVYISYAGRILLIECINE